jgi:putative membrane protein
MIENKDSAVGRKKIPLSDRAKAFLRDIAAGVCIGVAFIVPGFSGGSVAVMLGIYEKMINAITDLFKNMKKSIMTLLPIGIGLLVGAAALMFPLGYLIAEFPLPTVSVFVGLAIGGIPSIRGRVKGKAETNDIIALSIPLVITLLLIFIPMGGDVNLMGLNLGGYLLLFLVGMLGSCALVMPGISGSMLLLILGYYRPLIALITDHFLKFKDLSTCILVFLSCGLGIAVGFFVISMIMKRMLDKHPRGTYFAIIGFIIGSLPTVYVSTMRDAGMIGSNLNILYMPTSVSHYVICALLLIVGVGASYAFSILAEKKAE